MELGPTDVADASNKLPSLKANVTRADMTTLIKNKN